MDYCLLFCEKQRKLDEEVRVGYKRIMRGVQMKCGAKCFTVKAEVNGKLQMIPVTARTSIQARKVVCQEYGDQLKIIAVKANTDIL